jgi:DNA repair exonuclease SbcCD ATPase subunit
VTGYVLFLSERRERVRAENPSAPFAEITKILAYEWGKMAPLEKQKYLEEAEKDKERYLRELQQYKQTESYKMFTKIQEEKKREALDGDSNRVNGTDAVDNDEMPGFDIPIFTEEFLDHNKAREAELRQLRKSNTEYEEQNAILSKHIDNMKAAIDKLDVETNQQRTSNQTLAQYLDKLRATLTAGFASVPLPGSNEVPTVDTIDKYMSKLHSIVTGQQAEHETLVSKVKEVVSRIEYPG